MVENIAFLEALDDLVEILVWVDLKRQAVYFSGEDGAHHHHHHLFLLLLLRPNLPSGCSVSLFRKHLDDVSERDEVRILVFDG